MARSLVLGLMVCTAGITGCSRSKATAVDADASSNLPPSQPPVPEMPQPRFSLPIAATHVGGGAVLVAGFSVPDKAILVTRIERDGRTTDISPVLSGVAWSSDAELRLFRAKGGAALTWAGSRSGKNVRQMQFVSERAEPRGEPVSVGAAPCATDDALVWTEQAKGGKSRVLSRPWSSAEAVLGATIAAEREPLLVCGNQRAFALGQGEDDVTFAALGQTGAMRNILAAKDFGDDDERELSPYAIGDEMGLLRVGSKGQVSLRETAGGALGAWKTLKTTIPMDDDVVAADADAHAIVVVTTREASGACGDAGASAPSVHALVVDRATMAERELEVAPPTCGRELGPFWTGSGGGRMIVAWAERAPRRDTTSAPIAGLAYRALTPGASDVVRVARPADGLVDAGCDEARCYAVALAREPGKTNMEPEVAQVIAYP